MINVSTGGFNNLNAFETANLFLSNEIKDIELSGGKYSKDLINLIKGIKNKGRLQVHNYFPPPKEHFVLNLASLNENVSKLTINHIKNSIRLASDLGSNHYSFHAGFLLDPMVKELGKRIEKQKLFDRAEALDIFLHRVNELAQYAIKYKVDLMIENNVISKNNIEEFQENPFLMCDPTETEYIIEKIPDNVGILVDVAHLKVSANSLKFDPKLFFEKINARIRGYHLSDNNGLSDQNLPFDRKSWFWNFLKRDVDYFTIEVYRTAPAALKELIKLTKQKLQIQD